MDKIELVQYIGNEVCEGCGLDRDCGLELNECDRIANTVDALDVFLKEGRDEPR